MSDLLRITVMVIGLAFVIVNFYFVVRRKISERTTIIWLLGTLAAFLVAAFPQVLNQVARIAGVNYPPALLFLVSILVLLTIVMHQSMQISVLEQKVREIARTVALLGHGTVYPYYEQTHSVPRIQEVPNDRHVDS